MIAQVQYFLLIMMRITSFIWLSPGFSFRGMPTEVKLILSASLSISVMGVEDSVAHQEIALALFVFVMVKEILLGLAFGYIVELFFSGIEMAGNFIDFQVGFSMAMAFDPMLKINSSYYGQIYYWLTMIIFFLSDFHHQLIRILQQSFAWIPVSQMSFPYLGIEGIVRLLGIVFEISFNLAIPLVVVALLAEMILALLSRTVPQINVLILGMPLKIILSLVFVYFFSPYLFKLIIKIFPEMIKYLEEFIRAIAF